MSPKSAIFEIHPPHTSHAVAGLILNLNFHTKDPYGVGDTVNILLFPNLPLYGSYEAALEERRWDTAQDSSMISTYYNNASLLQHHKVAHIVGWEAAKSMLEKWAVFLAVLWVPPEQH